MTQPTQAQIEADAKFLQRELERQELRHRIELAATIERCAQVAEAEPFTGDAGAEIAAAIRKLKDSAA